MAVESLPDLEICTSPVMPTPNPEYMEFENVIIKLDEFITYIGNKRSISKADMENYESIKLKLISGHNSLVAQINIAKTVISDDIGSPTDTCIRDAASSSFPSEDRLTAFQHDCNDRFLEISAQNLEIRRVVEGLPSDLLKSSSIDCNHSAPAVDHSISRIFNASSVKSTDIVLPMQLFACIALAPSSATTPTPVTSHTPRTIPRVIEEPSTSSCRNRVVIDGTCTSGNLRTATRAPRRGAVFVTLLDPETHANNVVDYLINSGLTIKECTRMKTRCKTYASFHLSVLFDQLLIALDPVLWPDRCLVSQFNGRLNSEVIYDYNSSSNILPVCRTISSVPLSAPADNIVNFPPI